ncbi:MAG: response regulator [Candidatus Pacebacteria bacterium]|nr:response regulator [Candidatus Paceibacterota bacterium]
MKRIIIAESDAVLASIYQRKFTKAGFEVFCVKDGEECLELLKKELVDLIILSIKMDGMDGITCAKKIKSDDNLKDIKIVFMTAFSDPEEIARDKSFLKDTGALTCIKKGIDLGTFLEIVKNYTNS